MLLRLEFGAIELLARHADLRALQEELGVTQSKRDFYRGGFSIALLIRSLDRWFLDVMWAVFC